jgi:ribulose-phosphate 3-epimerase
MTVNPGFGGQVYIESVTEKISDLKALISKKRLKVDIEVDGGIDLTNIKRVTEAGANVIVAGSTVFNAVNTSEIINQLRENAFNGSLI